METFVSSSVLILINKETRHQRETHVLLSPRNPSLPKNRNGP